MPDDSAAKTKVGSLVARSRVWADVPPSAQHLARAHQWVVSSHIRREMPCAKSAMRKRHAVKLRCKCDRERARRHTNQTRHARAHTHTRHGEGEAEELPYPSLQIFDVFAHAASAYTFSKVITMVPFLHSKFSWALTLSICCTKKKGTL